MARSPRDVGRAWAAERWLKWRLWGMATHGEPTFNREGAVERLEAGGSPGIDEIVAAACEAWREMQRTFPAAPAPDAGKEE